MLPSSQFYNALAVVYEEYCRESHINAYLEKEIALVESANPQSILEFGIGDGRFAREYIKKNSGVCYVGVDTAEEMLKFAKDLDATLVCSDFSEYLEMCISEGKRFDCIVAPYTAIHHIETSNQLELFEKMKQVAGTLIINCLATQEEKVFGSENEAKVTIQLPSGDAITTIIHRLHPVLRTRMRVVPESLCREYLVYPK
jgi:SAM-dependent methyltransferase